MPYFVQRITQVADLERLESEWEEIDALSYPRTPFTSPLWNLLWWRHFSENQLWIRDELFALAVRDEGGRLVALAPLMRTVRPAWGPARMRELHFFGADPNLTELRGPVCRPEHRAEAMRALHAYIMDQANEWDTLRWSGIPEAEPESTGLQAPARTVRNYYLRLTGSWPELLAGLSRNMKEALRKCYNSLKRGEHVFSFRAVSKPQEVDAALDNFFELHRARADLTDTVCHNDTFRTSRSRRFLRDLAQRMAERDQLRIFQLIIDGSIVATRIGFVLGAHLYLYYSGYSPQWRKYSVMTTLMVEAIKWGYDNRFSIVNLSMGKDYAKMRWQPTEVVYHDYLVPSPLAEKRFVYKRLLQIVRHAPAWSLLRRVASIARRRND